MKSTPALESARKRAANEGRYLGQCVHTWHPDGKDADGYPIERCSYCAAMCKREKETRRGKAPIWFLAADGREELTREEREARDAESTVIYPAFTEVGA